MFRNRHCLRRWAAQVLLAWVFGVFAGVAHACVLQFGSDHGDAPGASAVAPLGHGHAGHADEDAHSDCADFCEKSAVTPSGVKTASEQDTEFHAIAILSAQPVRGLQPVTPARAEPGRALDPNSGPPLRIAHRRLTL